MQFISKNVQSTFQSAMAVIWSTLYWQFALGYLDGTWILSISQEADIKHVRHFLILLCDDGFTVKLKKCDSSQSF